MIKQLRMRWLDRETLYLEQAGIKLVNTLLVQEWKISEQVNT